MPPDSPSNPRRHLAAEQARLVAALQGRGDAPPGFDPARVAVTADTLVAKRRQSAAKTWPALASLLGETFASHFAAYAALRPSPDAGGPAADALAFARFLLGRGDLPDEGRVELAVAQMRRGLPVRVVYLPVPRRVVVLARIPGGGVRRFAARLPSFRARRGDNVR